MCTLLLPDWVVPVPDWAGFGMSPGVPHVFKVGMRFESHLGHVFSRVRGAFGPLTVHKYPFMAPSGAFSSVAGRLFPLGAECLCPRFFMECRGRGYMTCKDSGGTDFWSRRGLAAKSRAVSRGVCNSMRPRPVPKCLQTPRWAAVSWVVPVPRKLDMASTLLADACKGDVLLDVTAQPPCCSRGLLH
jgi:hypothetical protein